MTIKQGRSWYLEIAGKIWAQICIPGARPSFCVAVVNVIKIIRFIRFIRFILFVLLRGYQDNEKLSIKFAWVIAVARIEKGYEWETHRITRAIRSKGVIYFNRDMHKASEMREILFDHKQGGIVERNLQQCGN